LPFPREKGLHEASETDVKGPYRMPNLSRPTPLPNRPFRRAVFYIAGFDNIGARYYYMLFRNGLAHECGRDSRAFTITRPAPAGEITSRWRVETDDAGRPVEVDYFFLTPQDLLKKYNEGGGRQLLAAWVYTLFIYLRRGLVFRAAGKSWKVVVLLTVLFSFAGFFALGAAAVWGLLAVFGNPLPPLADAALAFAAGAVSLRLGLFVAAKSYIKLALMALYVGALHAQGRLPQLERRTADWARFIREQTAAEAFDEVLLVGHSSGVVTAVDVAAELLRDPAPGRKLPLALLTLGSIDAAVSAFRRPGDSYARRHHAAVAAVATSPDIVWIEYWSPWDFICIGSHDAVSMADIDLGGRTRHGPVLRELDLKRSLNRASYRRMFFNMFARHFQYLKGGDRPADYSYFAISCGARRLS